MIIIRPSIISASLAEPFPGWTDSLGLIGGFYAIAGHGILRDLPLNPKLIGDQIPVDYVSNQILAAIPIMVKEFRETGTAFLVTHACSSSSNGLTWGDTIDILTNYWKRDPFDKAIAAPILRAHTTDASYKWAFRYKSELPTNVLYALTRVIGTKKIKADVAELKNYVG